MANPSVDYEEILRASYHEVGHAMVTAHSDVPVYFVLVHRDGSGISETDVPRSPIVDLRLTLAGYIAEAISEGEVPTIEAMAMAASNEDDLADVERIVADGRIRADIAIPKAFEFVTSFFAIPSRRFRLNYLAHKLARTRYLGAAYFNKER